MDKSAFIKKSVFTAGIICVCVLLVLGSSIVMTSTKKGFDLWLGAVFPSLFPFFVCVSLLNSFGAFRLKKNASPIAYLFAALFVSAISGMPSGARLSNMLTESGTFSEKRSSALAATLNLASPIFIVGAVCTMAKNAAFAAPILIGHYASALIFCGITALQSRRDTKAHRKECTTPVKEKDSGILCTTVEAINDGMHSMLCICGAIIFFLVLTNLLDAAHAFDLVLIPFEKLGANTDCIKALIFSFFEMTGGCARISELSGISNAMRCALLCFVVTFGGICILAQSMSFSKINACKYIAIKLAMAIVSCPIAYAAALFLVPDAASVFAAGQSELFSAAANNAYSFIALAASSLVSLAFVYASIQMNKHAKRAERNHNEN